MNRASILRQNTQYEQLVNDLLLEMQGHTEERLNSRPADGGWSAIQTMYHLILSEELSLAYVRKKLSFNPTFQTADISADGRSFLLWLSLSSPFKFKAPPAISKEHLPEQASLASARERWLKIRAEWTDFLTQMPDELLDKLVYKHPRAGKLKWSGMLHFFKTHFLRHRNQMRRAIGTERTKS